jgi:alpha-2-macroglobulin
MVMANSIYEANPLSGVKINFISKNNQTVFSTTTNGKGVALIDDLKSKIKDFNISMITARTGDDFNYILFNTSRVETSRYDAGGKRTCNLDYDVFIYGDRNIYRPGDSVFINCVVRKFDWNIENNIPIKVKILLPNGKDYLNFKKQLDKEGSVESKFLLPVDIMTGIYTIEVYSGNDVLLNSRKFSVEEFMPDRISVRTKLDKTDYKPGAAAKLSINAMNLFGPPAANRNYEVQLQLHMKDFRLKNFPDYDFNIETDNHITFDETVKEGKTNEEGNANENLVLPDYKNIGIIEGKVFTTVFDETGRPVNRISTFDINTQSIYYGIKRTDYWVNTKQPMKFNFIAVTKEGKLLNNVNAKIQISRIFWETVMQRDGNRYTYNSEKRELIVFSRNIFVNGMNTVLPFVPPVSGEYEVAITTKDGECRVNYHFYAYGWGDNEFSSFKVSKEGQIDIQADKEKYQTGEKAKILFKTPFPAKIIVTVERDKILDYFVLETDNKAASLTLPLTADHMPNVYITATAIREMKSGNSPLTVAHGVTSIIVENPENKLAVNITAVEKSRSNTTQNIKVKTSPNAEVTMAVVDEGILQLTSFLTPDIYGYFYGKRALEVNSYDVYAYLYPELKSLTSSMGGDAGSLGKRVNPLTSKRVKLIALWSGIMRANSQGECNFKVKIPGFSGSLRIMAVAYKGKQFGSAEKNMKVADPVVISTALPRFMSPKDVVTVPVTLTNTTNKQINAKVSMQLTGILTNEGDVNNDIVLKPNAEKMIEFKISAKPQTGICEVKILVNTGKETFFDQTEIAVRPAAGLQKRTDAGGIKGGSSQTLTINTDFLTNSTSCKLIISKSPIVEFSKDLSYLLRYPYGCIEQTISAAFPQLYFRDLAKALKQSQNPNIYNPDYFIQEAISKVESMQQYNGGFAYWQGGNDISWWSSVYAANFLYEAKKAGYDVNNSKLENSIKYLEQMVRRKESYSYNYYENGVYKSVTAASRETFYSLYFLAMIGRQNLSIMNYYKSNLKILTTDSRYLLASAYALAGDQFSYRTILPSEYYSEFNMRMFGGCYSSYIRDLSISLYALLNVDPNNQQVGILVRHLSQELKKASWLSTQEASFALMALGKFARQAAKSDITGSVTIDGKNAGQFKDNDLVITQNFNDKTVRISTSGKGNLYYFYEVEGISASGKYLEEDNYMVVRKAFYDRFGNVISGNNFSRNDLIIVKITVYNKENTNVENVAITDILPACFEIENPRITLGRDYLWIKDKTEPQYMDIRDDRINFFGTVYHVATNYYYTVRAVSIGSYMMGPVSADAMYNGEYHSIWGGRTVVVK